VSDVCLLLEGRYPGGGGVVTWVDSLVRSLPTLSFSVVAFRHPLCGAAPTAAVPPPNVEIVDIFLPTDTDPATLPPQDLEMLAAAVPEAAVHHALSVGVASRVATRVASAQERPLLLTEHGIAWREKALGQRMTDSPAVRARESAVARRASVEAYAAAVAVTSVSDTGAAWQRALGPHRTASCTSATPPRRPASPPPPTPPPPRPDR